MASAGKRVHDSTSVEAIALRELGVAVASKSEFLSFGTDAIWQAEPGSTVAVRTLLGRVRHEAGTRNSDALKRSLSESGYAAPPLVFGRFQSCVAEPSSIRLVTASGRLVADTAAIHDIIDPKYRDSGHLIRLGNGVRQVSRNFPIVDHPALFAINSFCASYGHFVLTTLPIVLAFLDEIARHELKVVIPAEAPAWMTSTLGELGVTETMLLRLANRSYYFRTAIVSNILDASNTRAPNPACLTWSRALFGRQFPSLRKGRRIFVRRSAAGNLSSRILTNESEIVEVLRSNGFDVVEPAAMAFSSQVEAFRGADVVVSPHGSTLANLIFCRPGTQVLDLMPDDWVGVRGDMLRDVWAARLCAACSLDYSVLLSPSKILSIHETGNPQIVSRVSTEALASSILTS